MNESQPKSRAANNILCQTRLWAKALTDFGYTVIPPSEDKLQELANREDGIQMPRTGISPLAARRRELCLGVCELADRICVTRQTISNWETGRTSPSFYNQRLLAKALDLGFSELREMLPR